MASDDKYCRRKRMTVRREPDVVVAESGEVHLPECSSSQTIDVTGDGDGTSGAIPVKMTEEATTSTSTIEQEKFVELERDEQCQDSKQNIGISDEAPEGKEPSDDNEMVLPASSIGERLTLEHEQLLRETGSRSREEKIYSSLPPDLNSDVMTRSTKSCQHGDHLIVSQFNGRLLIKLDSERSAGSLNFDVLAEHSCVVCGRIIERSEMYLNFPEDLDRRRTWGTAFGFRYTSMLRVKTTSALSTGAYICTDHFSEECFRRYNFNKAAIETFGVPIMTPCSIVITPLKKRTPWDCTICKHKTYSVLDLQRHMLGHCNHGRSEIVEQTLREQGLACPFCRRCTYGYRTMGGFVRHLQSPPTAHFYLKRIYDIAFRNCRSTILDPADDWESWTERRVVLAYHGCEPPTDRSPSKRSGTDSERSSPVKRTIPSTPDGDMKLQKIQESEEKIGHSQPLMQVPKLVESESVEDQYQHQASLGGTKIRSGVLRGRYFRSHAPRRILGPVGPLSCENLASSDSNGSGNDLSTLTLVPTESGKSLHALSGISVEDFAIDAGEQNESETPMTVLKRVRVGYDIDHHQLNESMNMHASLFDTNVVRGRNIIDLPRARKTQRQLEANEARLRLFGDVTYVDVPNGYEKVQTPMGVKLVYRKRKNTEQHVLPTVSIANRRFEPIN